MQNTFDTTTITKNYTTTAATVASVIENLQFGGTYTINVTGEISYHTIHQIDKALQKNKNAHVFLDLSETTGLTVIKDNMFCDCENVTSIKLPNSVIQIGDNFFSKSSSLTSINIPNGVGKIGKGSFTYCKNLKSITLSSSVSEIGREVFGGCSNLTSFSVEPENPVFSTSIDGKMLLNKDGTILLFYPSASGTEIIPDSVTTIGKFAFFGCSNLTNVILHDKVIEIGLCAFSKCKNLTSFTVDSNNPVYSSSSDGKILLTKDGKTLLGYPTATGDVTIPRSVTKLGSCSFYYSEITSVTIPDSVNEIDSMVFEGCSNLKTVVIPDGITEIKPRTFLKCNNLTSVNIPDSVTKIYSGSFFDCSSLTSIAIPNKTKIFINPFEGCINLTSISIHHDNPLYATSADNKMILTKDRKTLISYPSASGELLIPDSVTKIEKSALSSCKNLKSITFPDSVIEIESGSFSGCKNLTNITLPNHDSKIDLCAFAGNQNLRTVTILKNATFTSNCQFLECSNLTSFIVDKDNPLYASSNDGTILFSKDKSTILDYPSAAGNILIPSYVTKISPQAFLECDEITSVTFSDPNSWFYTSNEDYTDGTQFDVTNPTKNVITVHRFYLYKK